MALVTITPRRIARDIRTLARAIDSLWDRNIAPAGIRRDADTIRRSVDEQALARVVAFMVDRDDYGPGFRAAQRIDAVLRHLNAKHKAAITSSLQEIAS